MIDNIQFFPWRSATPEIALSLTDEVSDVGDFTRTATRIEKDYGISSAGLFDFIEGSSQGFESNEDLCLALSSGFFLLPAGKETDPADEMSVLVDNLVDYSSLHCPYVSWTLLLAIPEAMGNEWVITYDQQVTKFQISATEYAANPSLNEFETISKSMYCVDLITRTDEELDRLKFLHSLAGGRGDHCCKSTDIRHILSLFDKNKIDKLLRPINFENCHISGHSGAKVYKLEEFRWTE